MITPPQSRAARGLLAWSQERLASAAMIGVVTVRHFEKGYREPNLGTLALIRRAFEDAGVVFIEPSAQSGGGVQLARRMQVRKSSVKSRARVRAQAV
jgi:transcriptional regulator with XRE-family HTH domain